MDSDIRQAQVKAALAVNTELVLLYWQIGKDILERQEQEGWGAKVINSLAKDLKAEFPDMKGFSFVGSQYILEVGGQEFRIDLLFYHLKLRCFIVIDLKMGKFEPAFSGQINFYVNVVDDLLRHPDDQPTIGMVLWVEDYYFGSVSHFYI